MKLYNSKTRSIDEFKPKDNTVRMYTCGPTVYHFAHIGNLRTYIMEDVLEKYINYAGYNVKRVMNITDVGHLTGDSDDGEDKMLLGAKREHKSVLEIAAYYADAFFADCEKLNIKKPEIVVPATSRVDDFIEMIQTLLDKGYAYVAGGNVYFDTSKLDEYYVFNRHNAEDLEVGVREGVEDDLNKRNKNDFVLWFTKSKFDSQELKWDSPWGIGYPGWHIECSAIAVKELGGHLDIHCGGIDNAFPHHTNEIAQSEAYLCHDWCDFWFHVRHLNDDTGKMSKSKGEFLTVSLLQEKGYDPLAYRYFCLMSHYRRVLVFTWESLDNATSAYNKLISRISQIENQGELDKAAFETYDKTFREALDGDLNTSLAVTALYDVLKADISGKTKLELISSFDKVLSLDLINKAREYKEKENTVTDDQAAEIESLISLRLEAKKAKDYAKADEIRNKLKEMGIILEDTPQGTKWKRA
ncbi:MAG: cysteine--tRNA ligase [Eubacteriales bacterium]